MEVAIAETAGTAVRKSRIGMVSKRIAVRVVRWVRGFKVYTARFGVGPLTKMLPSLSTVRRRPLAISFPSAPARSIVALAVWHEVASERARFLQLGLRLGRPLRGQKLLAPLRQVSCQGQLQLRIVRLSFDQGRENFVERPPRAQ